MNSRTITAALVFLVSPLLTHGQTTTSLASSPLPVRVTTSTRYGPFGLLDHRSTYGQFWFVEPLRAPEMDVDREFRLDYFHDEARGLVSDSLKGELEYNFGLLTVEVAAPWSRDSTVAVDRATGRLTHQDVQGIGNIELAARHPIFQWVSDDGGVDYTLAGAFEMGLPSNSPVSKDAEFVPQLFQLLRLGDHLSVEASAGLSILAGPTTGGTDAFEYNLVLGYNIEHDELPLPLILRTIPIFEFNGETIVHGPDRGTNRLSGTAGFRLNLEPVGVAQPRLGIGYVFPIDAGARRDLRWGIITSLVFEF